MRQLSRLLVALAILLGFAGGAPAAELRVHFLDVGQGDAILVRSPTDKTVLVDSGPRGAGEAVLAALGRAGVERLDLAIITHPHADHVGAMGEVLRKVGARIFMDPGWDHGSATYARLLATLEELDVPVRLARAGRTVDMGGGARLVLLAPEEPLLEGTRSDANANSVVARLVFGEVSVLLAGDAEDPTEERLLKGDGELTSTVLKVAHHGSAHSSSTAFLKRVKPEAAVITCGADNRYGHPAKEALARLKAQGADVYRTDLHGTVTLVTDGKTWKLETEREASTDPDVGPAPTRGPPEIDGGGVYASRNSSVYHAPWCNRGLKRIHDENLVRYPTSSDAEADGKRRAKDCPEERP